MDYHNIKILVVDDDEAIKRSLVNVLERVGFAVILANDGVEGFSIALREHPQLILLDISMPNLDGMAMMKKLRNSGEWGKTVPVILLTNLQADDKIMKGIVEDEPSYYLIKSEYLPEELIQKIKITLGVSEPGNIG